MKLMNTTSQYPPDEIWKPTHDDRYEVSNMGRVKRIDTQLIRKTVLRNGYPCVGIYTTKLNSHYVHRLVCAAFLGTCPKGYQVNHKDSNRLNNHISNLEYVTPFENVHHAINRGRFPVGSKCVNAKLSEEDVIKIRKLWLTEKYSNDEIGTIFGVAGATIHDIASGKKWKSMGPALRKKGAPKRMPKRRCKNATLTTEEVIGIKKLLKEGNLTQVEIGKTYSTTPQNIYLIAKGKNWKWLSV